MDEFKNEYGENWMNEIKCGWNLNMNEFLGKDLKDIRLRYVFFDYNGWSISSDMLKNNDELSFFNIYGCKKNLCYE